MSIRVQPRDRSWAIRQTLCFDSTRHAFVHRDIEITGPRISAVVPAGTSSLPDGVDGTRLVCTPGIVGIETAGASAAPAARPQWLTCVTSVGIYGATMREILASLPEAPLRTVALLRFGGCCLEQINGFLDGFLRAARSRSGADAPRPLTVMPVLETSTLMSAGELVEFAKFAKTMGARVGVQLAAGVEEALEFRARFYCSESALIAYLLPYDRDVTVFGAARLDRREVSVLSRMQCAVSIAAPTSADVADRWRVHAPLLTQGGAAVHAGDDGARAFMLRVSRQSSAAQRDCYADALTRSAAVALGLADVGSLAPGMKADMCAFERDGCDDYGAGSATLLSLLATRCPAFTIVDGRQVEGDTVVGTEREAAMAASYA